MAFPGLFVPLQIGGRTLVDGGLVNPVPYDLLLDECDITIAVDVTGSIPVPADLQPSFFDSIFKSIHIMQETIISEKLNKRQADIYIRPAINGIRMLEFYKSEAVYQQAAPAKEDFKRSLERLLS
jgi:NTE family protein